MSTSKRHSPRTEVPTYTATIHLGLREGSEGRLHKLEEVQRACQAFCDNRGCCVTVTPTHFVYVKGNEPGAAIGLIDYPRLSSDKLSIRETAIDLAEFLKDHFGQHRVTVVLSDQTVTLGEVEGKPAR